MTLGPGGYSIQMTAYWSERVYSHVFRLLNEYDVMLDAILLKPNMVPLAKAWSSRRALDPSPNFELWPHALYPFSCLKVLVPRLVRGVEFEFCRKPWSEPGPEPQCQALPSGPSPSPAMSLVLKPSLLPTTNFDSPPVQDALCAFMSRSLQRHCPLATCKGHVLLIDTSDVIRLHFGQQGYYVTDWFPDIAPQFFIRRTEL